MFGYLTSDLIEAALANVNGVWIRPQLRGALIAVAPSRVGGEPISPTRLGKWLSRLARPVPEHVLRLIQMKRARYDQPDARFLDGAYWEERSEVPEDIAGLVVFEDRAD
jgi:hypothetical protein